MSHLYLSTDAREARVLINEEIRKTDGLIYTIDDVDIATGALMTETVGFNPMSMIQIPPSASERDIERVVTILTRHKLFVTLDSQGSIKHCSVPEKYPPWEEDCPHFTAPNKDRPFGQW